MKYLLVVTVVVTTVLGGAFLRYSSAARDSTLSIEPEGLNLGSIWEQQHFIHRLTLKNSGDQTVRITSVLASCECTRVSPQVFEIPPGQIAVVNMEIDLTIKRQRDSINDDPEPFSVIIRPVTDDNKVAAQAFRITASIKPVRLTAQRVFDFGEALVFGDKHQASRLRIETRESCENISVACSRPLARVWLENHTHAINGDRWDLAIQPSDELPLGKNEFDVFIQGLRRDGHELPSQPIHVVANVLPNFRLEPSYIAFGRLTIGQPAHRKVIIAPQQISTFTVSHIAPIAPIKSTSFTLEANPSKMTLNGIQVIEIDICLVALSSGFFESSISFDLNSLNSSGEQPLTLRFSGLGVERNKPE